MRAAPVVPRPSAAERSRTTLGSAPTLVLDVEGLVEGVDLWVVQPDGTVVLPVSAEGALSARIAGRPVSGVLEGARLSPLPVPDRVLDPVRVRGRCSLVEADELGPTLALLGEVSPTRLAQVLVHPAALTLLRVAVEQVWLEGVVVDLAAFRAAEPDPLAADSDEIVLHLMEDHVAELGQLAHLFDPALLRTTRLLAPIGVDRLGMTFRLAGDHGVVLSRLNFPAALRGPAELPAALRALQCRAAQVTCPCCRSGGVSSSFCV